MANAFMSGEYWIPCLPPGREPLTFLLVCSERNQTNGNKKSLTNVKLLLWGILDSNQ